MLQAPVFDGHSLDAGALGEDGFVPAEVGVGGWKAGDAIIARVHDLHAAVGGNLEVNSPLFEYGPIG